MVNHTIRLEYRLNLKFGVHKKMQLIRYIKMVGRRSYCYILIICLFLLITTITKLHVKLIRPMYFILLNSKEILNDFNYKYMKDPLYIKEFQDFVRSNKKATKTNESTKSLFESIELRKNMCPLIPPNLMGEVKVEEDDISFELLNKKYEKMFNNSSGGHWKPTLCQAFHKVAIIVPYRNRNLHLKLFLNHMHKMLPNQQIDYSIYIVEQVFSVFFK